MGSSEQKLRSSDRHWSYDPKGIKPRAELALQNPRLNFS